MLALVSALGIPGISVMAGVFSGLLFAVAVILITLHIIQDISTPRGPPTPPRHRARMRQGPPHRGAPLRGPPGLGPWFERVRAWAQDLRRDFENIAEDIRREIERAVAQARLEVGSQSRRASWGSPGAVVPPTRGSLLPEPLAGRFRVLEVLGEGGFARVYRVLAPDGREYALKIPRDQTPELRRALAREAVHWEALGSHPNIVRLYEWDTAPIVWLLIELVPGIRWEGRVYRSLYHAITGGLPMSFCDKLSIATDIFRALAHAHERNIVHLDVTPSNILLAPGTGGRPLAKLTDWGIAGVAKAVSRAAGISWAYMAPEHNPYSQMKPGPWTDVYQAGLVIYELFTGKNYNQQLFETGSPRLDLVGDAELVQLLSRILEPDPQGRIGSRETLQALESLLSARCRRASGAPA